MATAREIRSKIGSVKNTQKITRAMEMVAASKMRKAHDRMKASRPYAERIREVIKHLAKAHPEYHHPYLQNRTVKRVGFIIVTSDRGLCGGLNINLLKTSILTIREFTKQDIEVDLALIGHKADNFFRRVGGNVTAKTEHIGDAPLLKNIIGSVKVMLDAYNAGNIDALYVCSNQFVTTMIQRPKVLPLLPITKLQEEEESKQYWDYIYEPDARELLDKLLERYIESQVYQAVIENIACEQAARMLAMKNATDNAGEIITELRLAYNKARQAAITKEISEIVGGAAAV